MSRRSAESAAQGDVVSAFSRTNLSSEALVLLDPGTAFHSLSRTLRGGWWVLVRRPLLLAFFLGCIVSLLASGTVNVRLVLDGALSFAFIPIVETAALTIIWPRRRGQMPLSQAVDLLFAGNAPWLLWLLVLTALSAFQSPLRFPAVMGFGHGWVVPASMVCVAAWSAYIDFHFFQEALKQPPPAAARVVVLQRALAWGPGVAYFFGNAIFPDVARWIGL